LLADYATTKSPPSPAILSLFACFFNDHYARIGSPSLDVHASRSAAEHTSSVAGSSGYAVPTSPSIDSSAGL